MSVSFRPDRDLYEIRVIEGIAPFLDFDIGMEVRNSGKEDIFLLGCINPSMPVLQKQIDDEWRTVYAVAEPECLSPPWVLEPGDVHRDTLRVEAVLIPGSSTGFLWEDHTSVDGDYRLERMIYQDRSDTDDWPQLIPLKDRISRTFQIIALSNPLSN